MNSKRFDELTAIFANDTEMAAMAPAEWGALAREYHQMKQVKVVKPADRQIEVAGHQKARRYLFHNSD